MGPGSKVARSTSVFDSTNIQKIVLTSLDEVVIMNHVRFGAGAPGRTLPSMIVRVFQTRTSYSKKEHWHNTGREQNFNETK